MIKHLSFLILRCQWVPRHESRMSYLVSTALWANGNENIYLWWLSFIRMKWITQQCAVSYAKPGDLIGKKLVHIIDIGKAGHPCVFGNVESTHRIGRISTRNLSNCKGTVFRRYESDDGLWGDWIWYKSWGNLHRNKYEWWLFSYPTFFDPFSLGVQWVG